MSQSRLNSNIINKERLSLISGMNIVLILIVLIETFETGRLFSLPKGYV